MNAFATTRWSVVRAAGVETNSSEARVALSELCEIYWLPLYGYARSKGRGPEDSEDLVQSFFATVLQGGLRNADPEHGRFRSYLREAFRHHMGHERARDQALKRSGGRPVLSLDSKVGEQWIASLVDHDTPEQVFERAFAHALLERCRHRLEKEWSDKGRGDWYAALAPLIGGRGEARRYAEIAVELHTTEVALKVAVHRLRQAFRNILRQEVAHTLAAGEDPDEELQQLRAALLSRRDGGLAQSSDSKQ